MHTSQVTTAQLGWVLAHDLYTSSGQALLRKGSTLDMAALERWPAATPGMVHLLELSPDDMHEDMAGLRVARAVAGDGVHVGESQMSRYDLAAAHKGLLRVDAGLLRAINDDGDVTVYTLLDRQPVVPGTVVASVKITPLAIPASRVSAVERRCAAAVQPLLHVVPFQPRRGALVVVEDLSPEQCTHLQTTLAHKLRWYGSTLTGLRCVAPDPSMVADAFRTALDVGNDLLLAAGGNPIDPLDPVSRALELIGARIIQRGAPTRGSMSWLAQVGAVPILNLAASRMYLGATVGDIYLPLLHTSQPVTPDDLREIGYGGLPGSAIALRFPPYDAQ
jgi:hypothetical protein